MNKFGSYLSLFAALAMGPVHADFLGWDTNRDGEINEAEYESGFEDDEIFEKWDANGDGFIDGDEFGNRLYDISDMNSDDRLTVSEFDNAIDTIFGEETVNLSIPRWDANGDNIISRDEFVQTASNSELYPLFDKNRSGVIESDELGDSLFRIADRDGDGALDEDEFLFDDFGF